MRKTLLYLLLLLPFWVSAQNAIVTQQNPVASSPSSPTYNRQTFKYANTQTTLTQIIPIFTTPTFNNSTPQDGAIGIGTVDSAFYFYLRGQWRKAGSGGGADSLYVDTTTLTGFGTQSIPLTVNIGNIGHGQVVVRDDTGHMWRDTSQYLQNTVISGLNMSATEPSVFITAGVWRIHDVLYHTTGTTTLGIDAQDATLSRYDEVYADASNTLHVVSGTLSLAPVQPAIPAGTVDVGSVLITPTSVTTIPNPPITNFVTTNTTQYSIPGNKGWYGTHYFGNKVTTDNLNNDYSLVVGNVHTNKGLLVNAGVVFPNLPTGSGTDSILVSHLGTVKKIAGVSSVNIYNTSAPLQGDRYVSNAGHKLQADSLYLGGVQPTVAIGGNMVFAGDSFVNPAPGANPSSLAFSTQTAALFGSTEVNIGMSGTDLGAGGGTAWVNNLSRIPTKGGSDRYLLFCLGQNDINTATSSYFEHQFALDWVTVLNNANSKGWAYNQIILTNVAFNPSTIPPGSLTLPQYLSRQAQFSHAVDSIAAVLGCIDINLYGLVKYDGSNSLLSDGQHLNNVGNTLLARLIYNKVYPNVTQKGQPLAVAGLTDLTTLRLPKLPNIPLGATVNPMLMGITAGDTVGRIAQLPKDIGTAGNFYLNGTLYQPGWTTPPGYTVQSNDFSLSEGARITGIYTPNTGFGIYNYVQPMDISGGMTFFMNGGAGAAMTFMNNSHRNMALDAAGNIVSDGSVKITGLGNKFYFDDGSGYQSGIVPLTSASEQQIFNQKSRGSTSVYEANGTDGAQVKMFGINYDGQALLQNDADFVTPDTYATVPSGKLTINSLTKGFIPPRMTTAQVVAMEKISSINVVNQGSGYTTASISLSGSTGSGFTATPVIVGGQIRSWTVTNAGTGYLTPQTATVTGDGTGSTALVQNYLIQGTLVFNTDSAKYQYYDGTVLRVIGNSGSGGGGTVAAVTGTTNRITSTGGTTPQIDISATFEGLLGKVANPLSQFASTTSAQLASTISDETGSGSAVFATSPTFVTPALGTPSSGVATNLTGLPLTTGVTGVLPIANGGTGSGTQPFVDLTTTQASIGGAKTFTTSVNANISGIGSTLVVGSNFAGSDVATVGAQKNSPITLNTGSAWLTTPVSASTIGMGFGLTPIQGTTTPGANYILYQSIAGATPTATGFQVSNLGALLSSTVTSNGTILGGNTSSTTLGFGTVATSNFVSYSSNIGAGSSNALYTFAGAGTVMYRNAFGGNQSSQALGASNSYAGNIFASSAVTTASSGTSAMLSNVAIKAPAITVTGGSTVTNAASLYIDAAPTGATANYALYSLAGTNGFGGNVVPLTTNAVSNGTSALTWQNTFSNILSSSSSSALTIKTPGATAISLQTNGQTNATLFSTGNLLVQSGGTQSDSTAYKFSVIGRARISQFVAASSNDSLMAFNPTTHAVRMTKLVAGTGVGLTYASGNITVAASTLLNPGITISAAGTLTLAASNDYEFNGTTTTWTLPAPSGSATGRAYQITIKNAGSGNITLNSASGNQIYDTSAVASITITPGSAVTLMPDGTQFLRE